MTLLDEIVDKVLDYISATGKNELVIDAERAKEAVADLLRDRLNEFLNSAPPVKPLNLGPSISTGTKRDG